MSQPDSKPAPKAAPPPPSAQRRVLIVDDDPLVRRMLYHLLADRLKGSIVETAPNGLAAQVRIPTFQPHLIITDLLMPRLDGAALCRWAGATGCPAAKLLVLTGCPGDGLLRQALDAGADAWFHKPPPIDAFVSTVERLLSEAVRLAAPR